MDFRQHVSLQHTELSLFYKKPNEKYLECVIVIADWWMEKVRFILGGGLELDKMARL